MNVEGKAMAISSACLLNFEGRVAVGCWKPLLTGLSCVWGLVLSVWPLGGSVGFLKHSSPLAGTVALFWVFFVVCKIQGHAQL